MKIGFDPALGINIGFGHFKRCIAIANMLADLSYEIDFVIPSAKYDGFIDKEKFKIRRCFRKVDDYDVIFTDRYDLDEFILASYNKICNKLIRIDDSESKMKTDRFSDVIINGNPYGKEETYRGRVRNDCLLLVGPDYIPMDENFCFVRNRYKIRTEVKQILITFGVSARGVIFGREICRMISDSNTNEESLILKGTSSINVKFVPFTDKIYDVFSDSDIAVCSSSSTCWQLAAVGVPFITFMTAQNQSAAFDHVQLRKIGIALQHEAIENGKLLDTLNTLTYDQRQEYSLRGRRVIDCKGAQRIVKKLHELIL
ncbi:MAG: glycosyltransferase [Nitrososphaeraceae archaeon]